MAKRKNSEYQDGMTSKANFIKITNHLEDNPQENGGLMFEVEQNTIWDNHGHTTTIYRDLDDYTIHAVITRYDDHHLMHILCSPCFMEILDDLGIEI